MTAASGQAHNIGQTSDLDRPPGTNIRTIAQLTMIVRTPTTHRAILNQHTRMGASNHHRRRIANTNNPHRNRARPSRPITELTIGVATPTEHRTILNRTRMQRIHMIFRVVDLVKNPAIAATKTRHRRSGRSIPTTSRIRANRRTAHQHQHQTRKQRHNRRLHHPYRHRPRLQKLTHHVPNINSPGGTYPPN